MAELRIDNKGGLLWAKWDDTEMVKALNRSAAGVRPLATDGLRRTGDALAAQMKANLRAYRGKGGGPLEASIGAKLHGRRGLQEVEVGPGILDESVTAPWYMTIEEGRTPGKPMPPKGVLLPWMAAHGIPPSAEFPIRRKIGEEGLKDQPFPYIDPAADQVGGLLDVLAEGVMRGVVELIGG